MHETDYKLSASDQHQIFVRQWQPDGNSTPLRGVLHINHGMAEHAGRYRRLAAELVRHGFVVVAHDTRGHGLSIGRDETIGHFADREGWNKVIGDALIVNHYLRTQFPGLPLCMFGHSMGSFVVRCYLQRHGATVDAAILCGSASHTRADTMQATLLVALETLRSGPKSRSTLINRMTFETYNSTFAPTRTTGDWLSGDTREVDKYLSDPLCGFLCTNKLWHDVVEGIKEMNRPDNLRRTPAALPLLLISGDADPMSAHPTRNGIQKLADNLRAAGVKNIEVRLFAGGRHEILNEVQRDEVHAVIARFLQQQLVKDAPATS